MDVCIDYIGFDFGVGDLMDDIGTFTKDSCRAYFSKCSDAVKLYDNDSGAASIPDMLYISAETFPANTDPRIILEKSTIAASTGLNL